MLDDLVLGFKHLEKCAGTRVDLNGLWHTIPPSDVVAIGYTLDPTKNGAWTTAQFYGCTTVDGKNIMFGHFAYESTDPRNPQRQCLSRTATSVVNSKVKPEMENAFDYFDGDDDTKV